MSGYVRTSNLGKRYARYAQDRPRTLKEVLMRGWRGASPVEHFWALRDIDLEVQSGTMLGVIGHNGAGKSTLLRLLGGVMRADTGEVETRGRVQGLLELNTGMHPELTGRENIFIGAVVAGLTRPEVASRFDEIVAFAELENFVDSPVRTYSTGMRMRLGFAVAAHSRPGVLLIDEVLSVGDLAFQNKCVERINAFKREGSAIVLITHDLGQVESYCDRALWLRHGEAVDQGDPGAVVSEYRNDMNRATLGKTPLGVPDMISTGGVNLIGRENRFGSLEMEIRSVRLLDDKGNPLTAIQSGLPLTVEIRYSSTSGAKPPVIGVSIEAEDGVKLLDVASDADRIKLPKPAGDDVVTLRLARLDLGAGQYFLSAGLYDPAWDHAYDYHFRAYPLTVLSDLVSKGFVSPPRQWQVADAAPSDCE